MKTRWITWILTVGTVIDQVYALLAENTGLLAQIGVPENVTKVIMTIGILWTAFSKSLAQKPQGIASDEADAIISPKPPRP